MKLNRLETHDRFIDFTKKKNDIGECCQDLINQRPFGSHSFYIFVHSRTEDNDPSKKRMIWQPRLTKPKSQENSMLFKAYPRTDTIKIIWIIPQKELWKQYQKGNITENKTICDSIHNFIFEKEKLDQKDDDDLSDEKIDEIYKELSKNAERQKRIKGASKLIL